MATGLKIAIVGGTGTDKARVDKLDKLSAVETVTKR